MNRITWTVIGFAFFLMGFIALILGFIGLSVWPMTYIDLNVSPLLAFIIKLSMIVVGLVIFYISRTRVEEA